MRILLCASDADAAERSRAVFEAAGCLVRTVRELGAAVSALELGAADFALLDADAQGARAADIAPRLAAAHIPFVWVSSPADGTLIERALVAGAIACFFKPLDVSVIVPSITVWIARAAELERLADRERALREAVQSSRGVATAVGILMERGGLSAESAFESLRRRARAERLSVRQLAASIVATSG